MSISLEFTGDYDAAQRNFDKLTALVIDTGEESVGIRFGTGTVTWPGGSQTSSTLTVSHGLGTTPIAVLATNTSGPNPMVTNNYTSTAFDVACGTRDESTPVNGTTNTFCWLAIG